MARFTFVDVETTGRAGNSAIVELGIATAEVGGRIVDRYETVVNPLVRMGASKVHGIRAATIASAPTFELIAADVVERLDGTVVVAYNAPFDQRFVSEAVASVGGEIQGSWTCALRAAQEGIPQLDRHRLIDVARGLSVTPNGETHSALTDAELCARVFFALGSRAQSGPVTARCGSALRVPPLPRSHVVEMGTGRRPTVNNRSLTRTGVPTDEVVAAVWEAFDDQVLTMTEAKRIASIANAAGLSAGDLIHAYNRFMDGVFAEVLADGLVDKDERLRLRVISHNLGYPALYIESRLRGMAQSRLGEQLQPGMHLVFTNLDEDTASGLTHGCAKAGIRVSHSLSKSVDLVVFDSEPTTGKARKARELGIPLMPRSEFEARLGGPPPSELPAPGWFKDPRGRHQWRWWDGLRWSDQVADNGTHGQDPI